jgi:serine-aspartate repeat-containing protein C/D/E
VWGDRDGNGLQDDGEAVFSGVMVELHGSGTPTTLIGTTTTATSGFYSFAGLSAGSYVVKVADSNFERGQPVDGFVATLANQGPNDAVDSDGDETNHTVSVTLGAGETCLTIDFGFGRMCMVGQEVVGIVYEENDGKEGRGEEDPGIVGATVRLYRDRYPFGSKGSEDEPAAAVTGS